jgi:VAD1 Analog of StAR-related lipid transfer domain
MDLFFSNEASFPISRYQREVIKDREVHYAKWKKSSTTFPPVFDRDISFVHPLSNPLGPAEAKTSRQQRFQRFGTLGATLQNTTNIQGVPGADCFKVEDRWVVETLSDNSVRFTVYFQIDFFKRTMIKALIQKNVKTETKKWFQGYVNFINRALHEDSDRKGRPQSPIAASYGEVDKENFSETLEHRDAAYFRVGGLTTICVVLLVVATLFAQLLFLRRNVRDLQDQVAMMRQDTLEVRAMLQQIVAFQK